jgi:glycosyltransferase involved in cell wall biosynthesis
MISVVIPAHNEAGEIVKLLQEFSSFHGLELVVAEDASTDGTTEIVQEFAVETATLYSHAAAPSQRRAPL